MWSPVLQQVSSAQVIADRPVVQSVVAGMSVSKRTREAEVGERFYAAAQQDCCLKVQGLAIQTCPARDKESKIRSAQRRVEFAPDAVAYAASVPSNAASWPPKWRTVGLQSRPYR